MSLKATNREPRARIAVVGAGWWSQGWHLPHLSSNDKATITAIVDTADHPKSNLNPNLVTLAELGQKYDASVYKSVEELLQKVGDEALDGVLIATPHATHASVGAVILNHAKERHQSGKKPLHILMEKPMTTDVDEAFQLQQVCTSDLTVDVGSLSTIMKHTTQKQTTRTTMNSLYTVTESWEGQAPFK